MPLYNYKCQSCNHEFEALNKIAARDYSPCPKCRGIGSKEVSAPKGINGGFYDKNVKVFS